MKYFEDFAPGQVYALGTRRVTAEDIVAFATRYDPQPFHVDEAAAGASMFGGLVASGWHTSAIFMGLLAATIKRERWASLGAPGIDRCRWTQPVRPGDTLQGSIEVLETRPSRTRPFGLVRTRSRLTNQDGGQVLEIEGTGLYALTPQAGEAAPA